ncbi:MAG: hypothetical protein Q9163_006087 [Psora crenata]
MRATDVIYYMFHTGELRSIIQWKVWHQQVHERDVENESPSLKICFDFLNKTSRSFSAVIQELHPELLVPVALFYLILRGLDTIEDDMTIAPETKDRLLRDFHNILEKEGWNYDGCGPKEKDRELLVQFQYVTEEFKKIKPAYREIIKDITMQMGNGMADYCSNAEFQANGVNTIAEYDLYCHYVAGLVGNGLTRLFVESGLANPALAQRPHLQESMGLFLQKTNIIRDIKEDLDDKRRFWPKEIWSKYVTNFEDLLEPANRATALNCSSAMVLDSLRHADECLFYLAGLKEQSVFNFAAIPQCMAIATLELVFRNPAVFERYIKITRGESCRIMMRSAQNLREVCEVFREYTRKIRQKNTPRDPNFLKISIVCGKIEQFIESIFPTQDPRAIVAANAGQPPRQSGREAEEAAKAKEAREDSCERSNIPAQSLDDVLLTGMAVYVVLAVVGSVAFISVIMVFVAWVAGARFDLAFKELMKGNPYTQPSSPAAEPAAPASGEREL